MQVLAASQEFRFYAGGAAGGAGGDRDPGSATFACVSRRTRESQGNQLSKQCAATWPGLPDLHR